MTATITSAAPLTMLLIFVAPLKIMTVTPSYATSGDPVTSFIVAISL
jgi:hypothetical protein